MSRQVGRVVAAVAVLGAVLSGCGSGPSQVGSAVIVGSDAIPLAQVQEQITFALSPERADAVAARNQGYGGGYGSPEVAREIVTGSILSDLLRRRAAAEGIAISDATLDATIAAQGAEAVYASSLYTPEVQRERIRDDLAAAELGARYVDRLGITLEFTGFATEEEAMAAARAVGAGEADAVFTGVPAEGQEREVRAADNAALATSFAFGSAPGSAILLRPSQEGTPWTLVHIATRSTDLPPAQPSAVDRFDQQDLQLIGYRMLQPDAEALGIRVNPRYGVWDPIQLGVVAEDDVAGTIIAPATPAAAG